MDENCLQKKQARFDVQFCFENMLDKKCNPNIPVVVARCRQKTMVKYQCTKYKYRRNIMQSKLLTGMWSLDVGGFCYLFWKYVCKYLIYIKYTYGFAYRIGLPVWVPQPFFWALPIFGVDRFQMFCDYPVCSCSFNVRCLTKAIWPRRRKPSGEPRPRKVCQLELLKSFQVSRYKKIDPAKQSMQETKGVTKSCALKNPRETWGLRSLS